MATKAAPTTKERAQQRAKYYTGLVWHVGAFLIINAFFWVLDGFVGQEGFQWAYWITGFWGLALAFHALAYYVDGRQLEHQKAEKYEAKDKKREDQLT